MLHFLCSCSYLFTFRLSSQFYWHSRSTTYFFDPPCIFQLLIVLLELTSAACLSIFCGGFAALVSTTFTYPIAYSMTPQQTAYCNYSAPTAERSTVMSVSVCLSVCVCVCQSAIISSELHVKSFVHGGRRWLGTPLIIWYSNQQCTSKNFTKQRSQAIQSTIYVTKFLPA